MSYYQLCSNLVIQSFWGVYIFLAILCNSFTREENSVVNHHCSNLPLKFSINVNDHQDKPPTMYWLPRPPKDRIKHDLLPTKVHVLTTKLSKLLNFCLTAVKTHFIRYCEQVYERSGKKLFWPIKVERISNRPLCQLMSFLHLILLY